MEKAYLVELVRALDPELCDEFEIFFHSKYFNQSRQPEELLALFRIIRGQYPDVDGHALEKDTIYPILFPGARFVAGKLEKIMVELNKLLRNFLLLRHYLREENEFQQQFDWSVLLQSLGLEGRYNQQISKLESMQEQYPWKDGEYFLRQFRLEYARYESASLQNNLKDDLNIPEAVHALDMYSQVQRIELFNHFLLQRKITLLDISEGIQLSMEHAGISEYFMNESPFLLINYKIFQLLQKENPVENDFEELRNVLLLHENSIEKGKLEQFYTYLRNICVLLINSGAEHLWMTLHRLHRDNLERGYLYLKSHVGNLTPTTCLNLVNVALYVQNYEWVSTFLEQHKDRIFGDNETHDFYRLNKANFFFAVGQYDEALDFIPSSSTNAEYHIMARRLEIKTYFELDSELLPFKVDAFKMYVSRASQKFLSASQRQLNGNFINFLLQIMQSIPGDRKRSEQLVNRIQQKKGIFEQRWLLEKARQLGGPVAASKA